MNQIESYIYYQKSTDKSPSTLLSYHYDLKQFSKWFQKTNKETMKLHKITPSDLRHYKRSLMDSEFKPQTINRRLFSLKTFLKWGFDTKKIKHRFSFPKSLSQTQARPKWLTKRHQHKCARHIERYGNTRDRAIFKILLNTGLRVQELCALKWEHITLSDRKGKLVVKRGKGLKYREVPLNKDARHAFYDLDYKIHAGKKDFVFIGQRGPLTPRGVQLILKKIFHTSPFGVISPHSLRHSFCENLVDSKVSLERVAALAGHERLETTKLYCHPSFEDLSEAVERIGELET